MKSSIKKHKLPKGFLVNGIHCGAKKKRKDLSLIYSKVPCKVEAVFTKNTVKAAPIISAEKQLKKNKKVRAIVINSGNANCMTGKQGIKDAEKMARTIEKIMGLKNSSVLVSSTGIIGKLLDMPPILKGMKSLVKGLSHGTIEDAADGIMTTDRFRKISSRVFTLGGKKVIMLGIAKGAGMIKPNMATMLGYIMTDANISQKAMKKALACAADKSFNAITVDGDMSTNDTVMLLANAEARNSLITEKGKKFGIFRKHLEAISSELSRMIVSDGEGASKVIEVKVKGAGTRKDAKLAAEAVADSLLVKCAVLGGDPNWGRIASSAGASGVKFDPDKIDIILDGIVFFTKGKARKNINRKKMSVFKGKKVKIEVNLKQGKCEAVVYSCDISKKYITLNSYYTT